MGKKTTDAKRRKAVDKRMLKKYGISLQEYEKMLAAQGGGCAICGIVPKEVVRYVIKANGIRVAGRDLKDAIRRFKKSAKKRKKEIPNKFKARKITRVIRLSVDHDHKLLKAVSFKKIGKKKWKAVSTKIPDIKAYGETKKEVTKKIRDKLKRKSVRGILCWQCNPGLKKYSDSAKRLAAAAVYIRRYKESMRRT